MELPITRRFIGALIVFLFVLTADFADAAIGRTPGAASVSPGGEAVYSIPLNLPPGTGKMTPGLSLEYRHRSVVGLLGIGWNIGGLSQIGRCPRTIVQDGVASPVTQTAADRFCLDGQRLVVTNGIAYGAAGAEYHTEIESFTRIRSYTGPGSGPQYFVLEAPDGRVLEYGATADSRIDASNGVANSTNLARIWALNRIRDRSGNVIDFEYFEDSANGSFRVSTIRYNSNPGAGVAASHQVSFVYEIRPSNEVDIAYVAGIAIRQIVRLDRIDVLYNGAILRRYDLSYEPALSTGGRSRLTSIQECGAGGSDCFAATNFTWQDGVPGFGTESSIWAGIPGSTPLPESVLWTMADINGDGRGDYIWAGRPFNSPTTSTTLRYRLGLAGNTFGAEVATKIATPYGIGVPFDNNGDGFADLLMLSAARQWTVIRGSATGFSTSITVPTSPGPQIVDYRGLDMNGDGLGDLAWSEIYAYTGNSLIVQVRYALPGGGFSANPVTIYEQAAASGYETPQGGEFLGRPGQRIDLDGDGGEDLVMNENYTVARISATTYATDYFQGFVSGAGLADINGDGCTDFAYTHHTGSLRVRMSGCGVYWSGPELAAPTSGGAQNIGHDWNNDGRDDLLLSGTTNWQVVLSNGDSLAPAVDTGIANNGANTAIAVDADGDGLTDLVTRIGGVLYRRLHNGSRPDVLLSATDGFGVTATFTYRPLTDASIYTRGTGAIYPEQDLQSSAYVVAELGTTDGTGLGSVTATRYSYQGLRRHLLGRGILGFTTRTSVDTTPGIETRVEETRRQDFPYTGLPTTVVVRQASGAPVSETTHAWSALTLGSGVALRHFPYASSTVQRQFEVGGAYDGAQIATTTRVVAAIDATSGLVTDETTTITETAGGSNAGSSSSLRSLHTSVLNDTTNWCLGRPQGMQLTASHTLTGGAAITRSFSQTWDGLKCRPTQQRLEPGNSQWQVTLGLAYDSFGNLASRSVTGIGMSARTTTLNWGGRGQLPISMTNPLSQTTALTWDNGLGLPTAMTDPNALIVNWAYDAFGWPTKETRPDQTTTQWTRAACVDSCDSRTRYQLTQYEKDNAGVTQGTTIIDVDQLGRAFRAASRQPGGGMTVITADADARGRVVRQYLPFWAGGIPGGYWQFDYDSVDRLTRASLRSSSGASDRAASWRYDGHVVTQTDPLGHVATETRSAWGNVLRDGDAAGGNTQLEYDAFGRLLQVRDALNNAFGTITYNARGMKLAQTDMDLGAWTFTHNALGELVSLRDAKSQVSTFTYDILGRPISRSTVEGASNWTWGASASNRNIGRLAAVAGPGYSESLSYDPYGRPARRTITSNASYRYDYAYNGQGLLESFTYPATGSGSRFKLGYEYESGQLVRIKDANAPATSFWRLNTQDAAGNVIDETLGASIRVITGFNPVSGAMDYRQTGVGSSAIQDLAYAWDANDNLIRREDFKQGLNEEFRYDALDRLDDARRNGAINLDLSYDPIGNISWKSDVCPTTASCFAYHASKKHAVTSAGGQAYGYDANGNMISRGGAAISWTSDNLPNKIASANGNSSQFWHGPAGNRWKQVARHAGTTETTIYAGELMEKVTRAGVTTWRHYVLAPTGIAALHLRYNNGTAATTRYQTHDYQGSTDKLLDAGGNILVAESFGAFGARRNASWSGAPSASDLAAITANTRDGYTGHEHLDNLDLIHMNGRVYDPRIGRFISADPYVPEPFSGQSLNRYAYVFNNPLSFIDPSGFDPETPCMEVPSGGCARITVIGARWADYLRYFGGHSGQVESASARDPCGQDSNALTCAMQQGRFVSPASVVLTAGTKVDSSLSQSPTTDFLQGVAARIGNLAFNSAPVTWLFGAGTDFEWFPVPDSAAGREGAQLGNIGYISTGIAAALRTTGTYAARTAIPSVGGVVRRFEQEGARVYYRVFSGEAHVGKWLTALRPKGRSWAEEALALPPGNRANYFQEVLVPHGTLLERSRALPVPHWGRHRGGAEQFKLIDEIPRRNFGPERPLP
jgi:RHS repeat-associated protein